MEGLTARSADRDRATSPGRDASLYDVVRYPGHAFPQTHPDRLAALAILFGLDAAAPAGCRLLELGCGDGGNLLPMAVALPGACFVGIDTSACAIARARAVAGELGLANVRFEEVGIEWFQAPPASFDYVVAHGVFSWVPAPVRERLLALCGELLAERGVAYVSYNALPGARLREPLRELLALALEGVDDPVRRIAGARRVLAVLSGDNEDATLLGAEAARMSRHSDATLLHDVLAQVNEPYLFSEFVARAARHGLQYLAEADLPEMQAASLPQDLHAELLPAGDPLRREQVLDYLKLRRFRQTLLCHAAVRLDRAPRPERVAALHVSSPARAIVAGERRATFETPAGARLTTDDEHVVAALVRVGHAWPAALPVAELLGDERAPQARVALCEALALAAWRGVVQLHARPPGLRTIAGERPATSPLARLQARAGTTVATLRHGTVRIDDELDRAALALLDGTRDRAALRAALAGVAGIPGDELAERLEASLERIARAALLAA
jgi:Predicted methyltransferase regulatory domain/Methyltransferase domain